MPAVFTAGKIRRAAWASVFLSEGSNFFVKIFINGRFLTQAVTGVQRYAREVVKGLDGLLEEKKLKSDYEFIILTPRTEIDKIHLRNIAVRPIGFLKGHLWEQIELPLFVRQHALINLCNLGPAFKSNQLITVHDASVYLKGNHFSRLFRTWYKIIFRLELGSARRIVTVSRFSRDELIKYTHVRPEKLKVIYEGHEHILRCKPDNRILAKNKLLSRPYVLAVSSIDPRKNFENIIKAMEYLKGRKYDIVIAGGTNPRIFNVKDFLRNNDVKYLGYVSDEELRALYEHAFCFLYPSIYEGFGLPPVEAMALQCPVIVSDKASLPEICGRAAVYCDPYAPSDIADKVTILFEDSKIREYCKTEGLKRADAFSWVKCSQELAEQIRYLDL